MRKLWLIGVALAVSANYAATGYADDCNPDPPIIVDGRIGSLNSGEVLFSYGSYIEKYSKFAHSFVWCIKANPNNQNVAEFKWGDAHNDGKYISTLVLPGQNASYSTTDSSSKLVGKRIIKFRRKNRSDWNSIDVDTVSSIKLGRILPEPQLSLAQFLEPSNSLSAQLSQYINDDGILDLVRLSSNKSLFLALLDQQKQIIAGGAFTVTLPRSAKVADLLQRNQYEKYERTDFIEAHAGFRSVLEYNDGSPIVLYLLSLRADQSAEDKNLLDLLNNHQIRYKISPSEQFMKSHIFSGELAIMQPETVKGKIIDRAPLNGRSILYSPARLDVFFGNGLFVLSTLAPLLFVPG